MTEVNFYLKKPHKNSTQKEHLIFLQFKYNKNRLRYSTQQKVDPSLWLKAKQRLKNSNVTTNDGKYLINQLLDTLSTIVKQCYHNEIKNGIPLPCVFRAKLDEFFNQNISKEKEKQDKMNFWELADRFIAGEFTVKGVMKSKNTLANYGSAKKHLLEFSKKMKYPITYESISLDMFYKLTTFLRDKGLAHNTIAKTVCILKVWLSQANLLFLSDNIQHKHKLFSMPEVEVDNIALTEEELLKLWHFDFSEDNRLERTRDLFLVGCMTGLRFSDFSKIKKEQIVTVSGDLHLKIITTKTKELVMIPVSPVILEIMKKYPNTPNNLPPTISIQKFNTYIKEALSKIETMGELGRLAHKPTVPLYNLVSSHTCRRTFCSSLHQAGLDDRTIMSVSGHKNLKSFQKYLKISGLSYAKKLSAYQKINASKYLLKVAN